MDAWRFLDGGWATGDRQMAVDDALLTLCGRGQSLRQSRSPQSGPPTLRLFGFRPVCLSLGRFQPADQVLVPPGVELVRRPTGGRAVLHRGDICYSIVLSLGHPLAAGSIRQSYQRLACGLAAALEALGLPPLAAAAASQPSPGSGWCFEDIGPYELALAGRKLVGSAQARRDGALLQQGSIRLAPEPAEASGATSLQEALGRPVSWDELAEALALGFARAWAIEMRPGELSPREEELARRLERECYAGPGWTSAGRQAGLPHGERALRWR
jgi:lipoate-protein ligase A